MSEKHDWRSTLKEVVDERRRQLGPHPAQDRLAAYHSGELGKEEAKALQDHLVLCPECAKLLLELDAFAKDAAGPLFESAIPKNISLTWGWPNALAGAAAILLLILARPPAQLPAYSLSQPDQLKAGRSGESDPVQHPLVFVTGRKATLLLRPLASPDNPPTARAYLRRGTQMRTLSESTLVVRNDGVVALEGTVGTDLKMPLGESELIVAVARPGALPSRDRLQRDLAARDSFRTNLWNAFKRKVQVLPPDIAKPSLAGEEPWVQYTGCRTVLIGPVCVLGADQRLDLWVSHPQGADIRIQSGGPPGWQRSYRRTPAAGGGFRYEIRVGWTKEVVVEMIEPQSRKIWALEVAVQPEPLWLSTARRLKESEKHDPARRLLEEQLQAADSEEVGYALSQLARLENDPERREQLYRQAIQAHRQAGRISDEISDGTSLIHYLNKERRLAEARQMLDSLPVAEAGGFAESSYHAAYFRGVLAEKTGDLRSALKWQDQTARIAERAGMVRNWFIAADTLAQLLNTVGLAEAAADIHAQMAPQMRILCQDQAQHSELQPCDCARFAVNRAWGGLLALEAGRPLEDLDLPALLDEAERCYLAGKGTCLDLDELANLHLNRALAALHGKDLQEAREHLLRADFDREAFPRLVLWELEIKARLLLEEQPDEALKLYDTLAGRAEESESPEAAWRAAFGRAQALGRLERADEAIQFCAESERILDQESLLVPMEASPDFIAQRQAAARLCLDLLLRAERKEEAMDAARRSAARGLNNLRVGARIAELAPGERDHWEQAVVDYREKRSQVEMLAAKSWQAPLDKEAELRQQILQRRQELRGLLDRFASQAAGPAALDPAPLPPDVLLVAYHPLPQGWAALAAGQGRVLAERIDELPAENDLEGLSSRLLRPFAELLKRAAEVRVIPYGPLREVEFHALPFEGGMLLDQAPVVYQLDLPAPDAQGPLPLAALVVAGPGLLEAVSEAKDVQHCLESSAEHWDVHLLEGDLATAFQVQQELEQAALFHYAGHAEYDQASRGWNSYLELSGGTRLTVDDILALPRVPRWVVLSGCQTSQDSRIAPLPSIGLAQAFLVAGSEAVVAAAADVSDADAAALANAFYHHWNATTPMAVALQRAQLEIRARSPRSDWSKFRILARSAP